MLEMMSCTGHYFRWNISEVRTTPEGVLYTRCSLQKFAVMGVKCGPSLAPVGSHAVTCSFNLQSQNLIDLYNVIKTNPVIPCF